MILAAGLGTRLKPFTLHHPKALAMVNGKTLLQHTIQYLRKNGITDIIVNVHHFADQIIHALEADEIFGKHITISDESGEVLETGGGLVKASWFFKEEESFVLMNADILTDLDIRSMIGQHNSSGALATLAISDRRTSRYFLFDENNILAGWRNIQTGEEKISRKSKEYVAKAFSGLHVISSEIFSHIPFSGKFSMVDVYLDLARDKTIMGYDHTGSKFIDVGKPGSIEEAERIFNS